MTIAPTEYLPDIAIPPGVTLRETLESLSMSQADLAERMGRPPSAVNEIIRGKKAITAETAIGLERVLPYPADFWMQLERNYQLTRARIEEATTQEAAISWMKDTLPLAEMSKRGFIRGGRGVDRKKQLEEVLCFFAVGSVDAWKDYWGRCVSGAEFAFRRSEVQSGHVGKIATWLRLGEIEAGNRDSGPYNKRAFLARLRDLRSVTTESPEIFESELKSLAECGVIVTLVKEIPSAGVSGATRWMGKNRAHIQLSLRYKTDDHFWFTFFHEAGHVVKHGRDAVFLETGHRGESGKEHEANRFAQDALIPSRFAGELRRLKGREDILRFAEKIGIAPGIVVGRMSSEKLLTHPAGNAMKLKRKLKWVE